MLFFIAWLASWQSTQGRAGRLVGPLASEAAAAPPSVLISEAEVADLEPAVALTVRAFFGTLGREHGFNNARAIALAQLSAEQATSLRAIICSGTALKATAPDGRLIGFVAATSTNGGRALLLTNLAVAPSERRHRLGRRLVERVLESAGCRPTLLEVEKSNRAAVALYEACGFEVAAEKEGSLALDA
mmetsp:Transcript_34521/g.110900  ORF Transcript_34521/g.110900 Transcript_34521/m.110900 type:complete len:188 (+) Transcript_34521:39-602(+)